MPEQPSIKRGRGRPKKEKTQKHNLVSVTLSPESRTYLKGVKNKSAFIEMLIHDYQVNHPSSTLS